MQPTMEYHNYIKSLKERIRFTQYKAMKNVFNYVGY